VHKLVLAVPLVFLLTACAAAAPGASQTAVPFRTATLLTQTRTPTPTSVGSVAPPFFSGRAAIDMGDQWFLPEQIVVSVGTAVQWINRGQLAHTATARDASFDSKNLEFGRTFTYTFTKPGRYAYFCTLHGDMIGEVDVR
jgi:plastocyanin